MARSQKVSLEVQQIVARMWARDEDDSRSDFTYHSPPITSTSPTPAPVIPAAPFAISAMQAVAPAPSVLLDSVPASPRLSQPLLHPRAHTPSHAIQSPPPPHSSASVATTSVPISSAASVLALPAIVSTAPPAATSVASSPAVSVVAVHAPSTVASVLPASFAILVSTTAVSALSAASAWPAVSLQSPGATTAPTSPVAAPALVLSAAVASAQSVALLVSSSISVDVTPSAKVSVTHDTSNDALPSPHATSIAQELNDYGKRLQGEPRRPPPLVSSPTCALSSSRPTATCYGEDLDATAGRRQRDSHTSWARRLPPQQQQQQQKQRQWQQLGRHQQHHVATTHMTRRNHATPPPASPHRARIPGHNDSDDTFDMMHTPQARPRPILPCCNAHPLCDDETTRAQGRRLAQDALTEDGQIFKPPGGVR
ncbi:hypothetical protein F5148DRAFT_1154020 [Russula earlei]|uniref:Uncharacterized protein n=1 Tax=Russula earlei TaxID=71964 RepID=A0ACC0TTJ0_9AGAM|nr:hypothetical protein F5148DRAFT_1154020 [Russula earlei]